MKLVFSLILCGLSIVAATPLFEPSPFTQHLADETCELAEAFHEQSFLTLIEEYQDYTRQKPKSPSENPVITNFMKRLSTQTTSIEAEISNVKQGLAEHSPRSLTRLKHYNSAAKTALKQLQKRQEQLQFLKDNTSALDQEINLAQHQKPSLTAYNNLRATFLNSPMLINC